MTVKGILKLVKNDEDTVENLDSEIEKVHELHKFSHELIHNWRILENISRTVNSLSKGQKIDEIFSHIKKEIGFLTRDLIHIQNADDKIKKLSKKVISDYENHPFKSDTNTLNLINIEKKEIVMTEKRIINLINNNKHSMKLAIHHLNILNHTKSIHLSNRMDLLAMIGRSQIQLRHVFLQTQAIIQVEAKLQSEKSEAEELFDKIKKAA